MKYVALLRGINVGGNNIIKMSSLKEVVESCGFTNVSTFIQSGNVIFETQDTDEKKIASRLEETLSKAFHYQSTVVVISHHLLQQILSDVPKEWIEQDNIRCYVAFTKSPMKPETVLKEIKLQNGVDFVKMGKGVLYMTTLMSGITKSGFTKLVGTKVYKEITIRNYNTTKKILERMEMMTS